MSLDYGFRRIPSATQSHATVRHPNATNSVTSDSAALAWRDVYGRNISDEERRKVVEFIQSQRSAAVSAAASPSNQSVGPVKAAVEELCLALFNTNEFIYMQ